MKKNMALIISLITLAMSFSVNAAPQNVGFQRLTGVLQEYTGVETFMESVIPTSQNKWIAKIDSVTWTKGDWELEFSPTKPNVEGIKNCFYYVFYDENYTKYGYIKAVKIPSTVNPIN